MKTILSLFGLVLVIFVVAVFLKNLKTETATINNHTFKLYVARTTKEKEVGLSEKTSLPEDFGMLFVFEKPGFYSFWMKNMKFGIDIIYINKGEVVTIYKNLVPEKSNKEALLYNPEEPADMVLEINAGLSQKYNLKKGDRVKIENLK